MRTKNTLIFIALLLLVACNKSEVDAENNEESLENINETGMPIVKELIELDFFAQKAPTTADDWNDVLVFNEYEKRSNIKVNWKMIPRESLEEKRNLALGSGDLPDAFHSSVMPVSDIMKYGEQGVFIPLNELIDEHAPNLKKILDENPNVKKALTMPDGNIYSLPTMGDPEFLSLNIGAEPFINEKFLEHVGLEMPETTDDFYEYLKAVKETDVIGDGETEAIPYGFDGIDTLVTYMTGAFGIANMGSANANIDLDPNTEELRFYPITDRYKEMLEYLNKLYSERLIQQNIFTLETEQYHANASNGLYGASVTWSPVHMFGKEKGSEFTGMPALEGPHGDKMYTGISNPVHGIGSFLITRENEHPVATIKWVDYFYGDEGMKLFFLGVEGVTFVETPDGEFEFMDHITDNEDGLSVEQASSKYLTYSGGGFPAVITEKYFKGSESSPMAIEAAEELKPYLIAEPWGAFVYTKEENDKLDTFGADIDKYVTEMRDKFISGDVSFSDWNNYVETIEGMGLEEYMNIKNAAYERYEKN